MPDVFHKFFFQPLQFGLFRNYFQLQKTYSQEEIQELYERYLYNYGSNAYQFYRSQFERDRKRIFTLFQEEYNLQIADDWCPDEYEQEQWISFAAHHDLWEHKDRVSIEATKSAISSENYRRRFNNSNDHLLSAEVIGRQLLREIDLPGPTDDQLSELWFNSTINNRPEYRNELRRLPYNEYLKTEHWQAVRAAMLLICRARCHEVNCWLSGDSWYGGDEESNIHVHHLSYRNRGNERFHDLTLLCRNHHAAWHIHEKDPTEPEVIIYTTV